MYIKTKRLLIRKFEFNDWPDVTVFHKDDVISLDGGTGDVMEGAIDMVEAGIDSDFETFFGWVNVALAIIKSAIAVTAL